MATVTPKLMTAEEFYEFVHRPENRDKVFELEHGEVVEHSLRGKRHGFICANVTGMLGNYAVARKQGYVCSNDTGLIVERDPDKVRGPDVMYFDDVESVDQVEEKFGEEPPTLAVEVLSPNDTVGKVNRRVREQLKFGTPMIWVLDPEARNVTVYRPGREYTVFEEGDELTGEELLPGFRCLVSEFFKLPGQS